MHPVDVWGRTVHGRVSDSFSRFTEDGLDDVYSDLRSTVERLPNLSLTRHPDLRTFHRAVSPGKSSRRVLKAKRSALWQNCLGRRV